MTNILTEGQKKLFSNARNKLLKEREEMKRPFRAETKPYRSTAQIKFEVVDIVPTAAAAGSPPACAHLVLRKDFEAKFFTYKIGDQIDCAETTRKATEADTNQTEGSKTNDTDEMVIEGVSMSARAVRVKYDEAAIGATTVVRDRDVIDMYRGLAPIYDPGSIVAPPQVMSPFNLEHTLLEMIRGHITLDFNINRNLAYRIGTIDQIPEGGSRSYLRANGEARADNFYEIREGLLWRKGAQADSSLEVVMKVREAIVMPIDAVPFRRLATLQLPQSIYLDLQLRLHGLVLSDPSQN